MSKLRDEIRQEVKEYAVVTPRDPQEQQAVLVDAEKVPAVADHLRKNGYTPQPHSNEPDDHAGGKYEPRVRVPVEGSVGTSVDEKHAALYEVMQQMQKARTPETAVSGAQYTRNADTGRGNSWTI